MHDKTPRWYDKTGTVSNPGIHQKDESEEAGVRWLICKGRIFSPKKRK